MPNRPPNPESVPALRKEMRELTTSFKELQQAFSISQRRGPWLKWIHEHPWKWVSDHPIWSKVVAGLITAMIIGFFAVAMGAIHGQTNSYVDDRITTKLRPMGEQISTIDVRTNQTSQDIAEIKGTLKAWAPFMTPQFFKRVASLPDKQFLQSLPQLKAVAQVAGESKTEISTKDISDVGKRTLDLSKESSQVGTLAWETIGSLMQYRSALNTPPATVNLSQATPIASSVFTTEYFSYTRPGLSSSQVSSVGSVPKNQAAQMNIIDQDFNSSLQVGNAFLINTGGSIQLDKMHMKNVVFVNVHIVYEGGSTKSRQCLFP